MTMSILFFYCAENWLLLPIMCVWNKTLEMCGTKRLNLFFRLHEASEVLKHVIGVCSYNFKVKSHS